MKFYSTASNLRVQLAPGGMHPTPNMPGIYSQVVGEYAQFEGGQYETKLYGGILSQEQLLDKLRSHSAYGYGKAFWAEVDRPESERVEDELNRLRAENEHYRKTHGREVVVLKESEVTKDESGTVHSFNELKQIVKERGIKAELTWKKEDYLAALATTKEG